MKRNKNKYRKVKSGYNNTNTVVAPKLDELVLDNKPKVIVSQYLKSQIDYFHKEVGNVEWSGVLHYKITKGSILEPANLEIRAENVYLMDIGTSSYTEYEMNEDIIDFYDKYPEVENMKKGHLHTH